MSNIIHLVPQGDGPRVDSREIAASLGIHHHNAIATIRQYGSKFLKFGVVLFETEKPVAGDGGRPVTFALLNEDQCYFLLSLSRNTPRVVDLKVDLVAAFGEARRRGAADRLSLLEQRYALQAENKQSAVKGRFGSKLMTERKGDLRELRPRLAELEAQIQPQLPLAS